MTITVILAPCLHLASVPAGTGLDDTAECRWCDREREIDGYFGDTGNGETGEPE
jgi:hypothetical protein